VNTVRIGDVEVHRVLEWVGPIKTVDELFPDTPADTWTDVSAQHWTPHTRAYRAAIQTWVLRSAGRTVLIDTGVGNDRDRPQAPSLDHLRTAFLQRLGDAGVQPADVDLVINTHIHYDHVGWNTRLNGGRWTPTFPNATYLVPQADYDHFHPGNAGQMRPPRTEDEKARFDGARLVFADSITPIDEAGQMHTWDGEHRVDRHLRLAPAPGHTPDLRLSGWKRATGPSLSATSSTHPCRSAVPRTPAHSTSTPTGPAPAGAPSLMPQPAQAPPFSPPTSPDTARPRSSVPAHHRCTPVAGQRYQRSNFRDPAGGVGTELPPRLLFWPVSGAYVPESGGFAVRGEHDCIGRHGQGSLRLRRGS